MEETTIPENNMPEGLERMKHSVTEVKRELSKVIIGQSHLIDLLMASLFTGGHVLIEGVPGIAKTLTAKLLAQTISLDFSRIQFTPDLMPTDVTGTSIFNVKNSEFEFRKGPVFSNVVLIDEINRSPAKTQASLFEVMEEKQVTIDGTTFKMNLPFFVIATQNPVEQEGLYRLPEAQLDRFVFKIKIHYPSLEEETSILR
ncbi:MAG TPA: AAA family ATPase, partial [Cytophagaceae bacterium]|nr:AAA family ATPase [Cytophagaceae bacterium]